MHCQGNFSRMRSLSGWGETLGENTLRIDARFLKRSQFNDGDLTPSPNEGREWDPKGKSQNAINAQGMFAKRFLKVIAVRAEIDYTWPFIDLSLIDPPSNRLLNVIICICLIRTIAVTSRWGLNWLKVTVSTTEWYLPGNSSVH